MNDKAILKINSLYKEFQNVKAVNDLSFTVDHGDIFAFLGPNGAGKTTTLRILLDIIKSDKGRIEWNIGSKSTFLPDAKYIGYLPEERGLYLDIPILKSLVYLATIRGMKSSEAKKSAIEWLEKLGLADRVKEKLQTLSKGNQQKIQFVAAILHKPSFAILDEPFSGLDPLNQELFVEYLREINNKGTTILLSAHQMSLVEKLANKVFLINKGEEIYNGTLTGIYDTYGNKNILELKFEEKINIEAFQKIMGLENFELIDDFRVKLFFGQGTNLSDVFYELAKLNGISDIVSHKPDLHEIFLYLVRKHSHEIS